MKRDPVRTAILIFFFTILILVAWAIHHDNKNDKKGQWRAIPMESRK